MRHRLHLSAFVVMSLIGATTSVFAQRHGGSSTTTTGMGMGGTGSSTNLNAGGMNQPEAPTLVPGTMPSPGGLPGDDTGHPGLPARVGD